MNFDAIRKWYSGKALTILDTYVIPTLTEAEAQGYWPKGASRKVTAALNKQTVAIKFANKQEVPRDRTGCRDASVTSGLLGCVCDDRAHWFGAKVSSWGLIHAMSFGFVQRAPELMETCNALAQYCANDAERDALAKAREWCIDCAPVAELLKLLDSRRPPIKVIFGTLSATVVKNFAVELQLDFTTIRVPPTESYWVTVKNKKTGADEQVLKHRLIWPMGTRFNASRYSYTDSNRQCQACGHAIKDPFNWVPLLIDGPGGKPFGFFIGRDCAKNLFGCHVEGDALFEEISNDGKEG